MANFVKHSPCPKCGSRDNLAVYDDDSCFCFGCNYTILSDDEKAKRGIDTLDDFYEGEEVSTKETITQEEIDKVKSYTGTKGCNLRGITDATYKAYSIRHKYSEETGEPVEQYYPILKDNTMSGFKIRILPKNFSTIGKVGKESDMFGQFKFWNTRGKFVVVTAGEVDCLSAFQMLEDYRKSRNSDFEPIPVVSSVIGESGSHKQIQLHYEWFNRFEKILICYDSDDAGREAVHKVAKVLPKGKTFIMELPLKDVNAMLEAGKEKQFIDCFFKAKAYTPNGIVASSDLMDKIIQEATTPKIPLPPFMHKVQDMMAGGIPLGVVVNLASASGTGKSTIVDELTYFWVFNSPHKIGVVTLESDCGQYGTKILSRHISQKIDLISDVDTKLDFLAKPEIIEQANILWNNPDGSPRWYLVDERDGGLEDLKEQIMKLIIACDCKVIILDPIQDILDGLGNDEQAVFLRWMKGTIKSHKVTFINVNHVRKNGTGQKANSAGADLHEEDMMGSSTLFKSSACNLLFTRNKEAEDEIERNTTLMKASKIRWTGNTGVAGAYYYDNKTHTMHDKDDYFSSRGGEFYAN